MRRRMNRLTVSMSALGLVLAGLIAPSGAMASDSGASMKAPPRASDSESCWYDLSSGEGLCVPTGDDLIAAVAKEKGVLIVVPEGESISDRTVSSSTYAQLDATALLATYAVSQIYDDVNYGGGSYTMTTGNSTACQFHAYGFVDLNPLGWYGRVSSFRSYSGCRTAVFENTNYGGSSYGYFTNASSLGVMNDKAKSWRVID